eukprot:gnl/Spiro4/21887_TR10736_c0_g2_i1.p1 gnl/Spiro4/21887_TR10736_c0_g2~~gnl/Spiro4/21887_TR10736_c0_g2_i1.p1  ORF type:complete len:281 (+),score=55.08 gnl/Spiro4/21887_TR10736_c0_g2_i1:57-845(+)
MSKRPRSSKSTSSAPKRLKPHSPPPAGEKDSVHSSSGSVWLWADSNRNWVPYDEGTTRLINIQFSAYCHHILNETAGPGPTRIAVSTDHYIDFSTMQQVRFDDESRTRPVRGPPRPSPPPKFVLEELSGDLFESDSTAALAHCVSEDLVMGKGIAAEFKRRFGGIDELKRQNPRTGGICSLRFHGRWIIALITKKIWRDKPTYSTLRASLEALREHCLKNRVQLVAIPRLGCGLDGLKWQRVRELLRSVFESCALTIRVYSQ